MPRKTVLLVDDEYLIIELLSYYIEAAGYEVVKASDATEAMRLAQTHQPALIVCDCRMPGLSGLDFLGSVRIDAQLSGTPFILMSGECPPNFPDLGANAFLPKPFEPDAAVKLIESLLGPSLVAT